MRLRSGRRLWAGITSSTLLAAPIVMGAMVARGGIPVVYPQRAAEVQNGPRSIAVLLPEKVGLWLDKKGSLVGGIERITAGQHEVLGPIPGGAPAPSATVITGGRIRPVRHWTAYLRQRGDHKAMPGFYKTPATFRFRPFPSRGEVRTANLSLTGRYLGWRKEGKWTCVKVRLKRGQMDWLIAPTKARIGHAVYRGIQWRLRLQGVGKVISVGASEPLVVKAHTWHFTQRWGKFSEPRLQAGGEFHLNWTPGGMPYDYYFAGRQPFFFAAGAAGATVSYFKKVVPAGETEAQEGDRLLVRLHIPVRTERGSAVTPDVKWVFSPGDFSSRWTALNEWTHVFDFTGHYYRSMMGVRRVEPLPTLFAFGEPGRGGEPFRTLASKLPQIAKIGIKVLFVSALESTVDKPARDYLIGSSNNPNVCAVWRSEISPHFGGKAGLKQLRDAAHRLGVKVIIWSATGDFSNSSPLLRQHPDWLAWNANGTPMNVGYGDVAGVSFRRGALGYVLRKYLEIRGATGLNGMWQDSFITFGVLTDYRARHPYPQLGPSVKLIREEQAMGCHYVMIEGCGPFGLSSGGYGLGDPIAFRALVKGKEYGLYYVNADTLLEPHSYYRTLASKGGVWFELNRGGSISNLEALSRPGRQFIVAANRAYIAVLPYMQQRHLIGKGKNWLGVEWLDGGKPRVLFAFTPMPWKVPTGATVRDVTAGVVHIVRTGIFQAAAWHTYLIVP